LIISKCFASAERSGIQKVQTIDKDLFLNMNIRKATTADFDQIWEITKQVIAECESLVFAPDSSKEKMLAFWCAAKKHVYVVEINDKVVGTFFLCDNQPDMGSHVANGGYMTLPSAGGQGIGYKMGEYSIQEAKRLGYKSIQFNIVLKSNEHAVRLWEKLGFKIVGELPEVFDHPKRGLTNAFVMWRRL